MHLGVCVPGEGMPLESVRSYAALMMALVSQPPPGLRGVSQHFHASSMLPYTRARVIDMALSAGATHLLLLDADMTYPANVAWRLWAHGRPFVACNAVTRRPPHRWTAVDRENKPLDSSRLEGLGKAYACGVAVAMVEARVIEKLERPLFDFFWTGKGWRGEDHYFCEKVRSVGFQPMIDHDLSREIGHVGTRVLTGRDVENGADE